MMRPQEKGEILELEVQCHKHEISFSNDPH
jgi:hypothetical protein